jgi:hypothetical protein
VKREGREIKTHTHRDRQAERERGRQSEREADSQRERERQSDIALDHRQGIQLGQTSIIKYTLLNKYCRKIQTLK